jgi:hypothetical protein
VSIFSILKNWLIQHKLWVIVLLSSGLTGIFLYNENSLPIQEAPRPSDEQADPTLITVVLGKLQFQIPRNYGYGWKAHVDKQRYQAVTVWMNNEFTQASVLPEEKAKNVSIVPGAGVTIISSDGFFPKKYLNTEWVVSSGNEFTLGNREILGLREYSRTNLGTHGRVAYVPVDLNYWHIHFQCISKLPDDLKSRFQGCVAIQAIDTIRGYDTNAYLEYEVGWSELKDWKKYSDNVSKFIQSVEIKKFQSL